MDLSINIRRNKKYLKSIVSPAAKFELALLIVERKPRNVDFTGTFENARRKITAATVVANNHICLIGAVKLFIGTAQPQID